MTKLLQAEWERLWSQKTTWFLILSIPLWSVISTLYHFSQHISSENTYSFTSLNYITQGLCGNSMIFFDLIALAFVSRVWAYELEENRLRFILMRSFSKESVFIAKFSILGMVLFLSLFLYVSLNAIIGFFIFPHATEMSVHVNDQSLGLAKALWYHAGYFLLSYTSLFAVLCVTLLIAIITRSQIFTFAIGMTFIFFSFLIPQAVELYNMQNNDFIKPEVKYIFYSSILSIQGDGISLLLNSWSSQLKNWIVFIFLVYTIFFGGTAFLLFKRQDRYS